MRWILVIAILVAVPILVAALVVRRPGAEHQPRSIDATVEAPPPSAEETRRMDDPPPGSRGHREQHGKP